MGLGAARLAWIGNGSETPSLVAGRRKAGV
jgi:hypothetical protein